MDPLNLKKLNAARRARQAVALVTSIADGRDRIVLEGDPVGGELGEALGKAFRSGKSTMVTADGAEFFINVHLPPARAEGVSGCAGGAQGVAACARARLAARACKVRRRTQASAGWPQSRSPGRPWDECCATAACGAPRP